MDWRSRYRAWRLKRLRRALSLLAVQVHNRGLEPGDSGWDEAVKKHDVIRTKIRMLESSV